MQHSLSWQSAGLWLLRPGFDSRWCQTIFFYFLFFCILIFYFNFFYFSTRNVISLIGEKGSDFWWTSPTDHLLPGFSFFSFFSSFSISLFRKNEIEKKKQSYPNNLIFSLISHPFSFSLFKRKYSLFFAKRKIPRKEIKERR